MKVISLSNARKELFGLKDDVTSSHTPCILTHKTGNVVMIAEDDYWNMVEHLYILKDKITMDAIKKAISDRKNGKTKYMDVDDLLKSI